MQEQAWQHNDGRGRWKTARLLGMALGMMATGVARSGQDPRCPDDRGGDGHRHRGRR